MKITKRSHRSARGSKLWLLRIQHPRRLIENYQTNPTCMDCRFQDLRFEIGCGATVSPIGTFNVRILASWRLCVSHHLFKRRGEPFGGEVNRGEHIGVPSETIRDSCNSSLQLFCETNPCAPYALCDGRALRKTIG